MGPRKRNPALKRGGEGTGNSVLIFGAGNLASNVLEILLTKGFTVPGYISTERPGTIMNGIPVLGDIQYYMENPDVHNGNIHIAIGENSVRFKIFDAIKSRVDRLVSVISDQCILSDNSFIDRGTYISHGAIIQHDVSAGLCCIIDTGVILEHHVKIGSFVNISPGTTLCGGVTVCDGAVIGAGATVIEKIQIGENSLVGAGSVVIHDIEPNVVAVGNPAKIMKKRDFFDRYIK